MNDVIRILIVDDHEVVRKGYDYMLQPFDDLELIGEAESGEQAVELCKVLQPDVVLMDIYLPGITGIQAIQVITAEHPHIKILALTSFEDEKKLVQDALDAGAHGFIYKKISISELITAIHNVTMNKRHLSPDAAENLAETKANPPQHFDLTEREQQILQKMGEGLTNNDIADQLSLSHNTIKTHLRNLFRKLNASTRTEAVRIALKNNLIKQ